jgi:hypothetical protein
MLISTVYSDFKRRIKKEGNWRRHPDLNWRIKVLQTSALPLGYAALYSWKKRKVGNLPFFNFGARDGI